VVSDAGAVVDGATNKAVVARAVERVINGGDLDAVDELYDPGTAADAKAWVAPFRASFPDVYMATVVLVAEGDTVVGHFRCSGTHLGRWLGKEPTGRRFTDVDEVYWFTRHYRSPSPTRRESSTRGCRCAYGRKGERRTSGDVGTQR
jgi:SnoaL-like polyketide cyclase